MNSQDYKNAKLPENPGVYLFKQRKSVLYVGKATSLKDRVKSYFSKDLIATRGPILVDMVFKADRVEFEQTDSVLEALILEAFLIKKLQPKYNTKEKDNKSYNYVVITDEQFPKVLIERGKNIDFKQLSLMNSSDSKLYKLDNLKLSTVYGPFPHGAMLKEALRIVRRIFPFIDKQSSKKDNYEFYRQLGLVPNVAPTLSSSAPLSHSRPDRESMDQEYFSAEKFPDHDSASQPPSLSSETLPSSPRIRKDDNSDAENSLKKFIGKNVFEYPAYSSKTVNGKPLFSFARSGDLDDIEIPKREMEIFDLKVIGWREINSKDLLKDIERKISEVKGDFRQEEILEKWRGVLENSSDNFQIAKIQAEVSSGTYMRTLAHEWGKALGLPALAYHIVRTGVGEYEITHNT